MCTARATAACCRRCSATVQRRPSSRPEQPTPGIEAMTELLYRAYATDLNDRLRDIAAADPRVLLRAHDIPPPPGVGDDPNGRPDPPVAPWTVYEDERVRVSATLVQHAPVFPSLAFRFDTDDGAVVFSGDTGPTDNLVRLAKGADVLVHEVIDRAWVKSFVGPPPRTPAQQALIAHLLHSHTTIGQVGPIAERAGVDTLVLTHLVPADNPRRRWLRACRGFSGRLVVGEDLLELGVGRPSRRS